MKKNTILSFAVLCLFSVVMGCTGFSQKVVDTQKYQAEHLALIDKRIQEHDQKLSDLDLSIQNIGKRIGEISQETTQINANYLKLHTAVNSLDSHIEKQESSRGNNLSEIQGNIHDIEKRLYEIREAKDSIQDQVTALQTQISHIEAKLEQYSKGAKDEITEEKSKRDEGNEASSVNQKKAALQDLLDNALALYRDGHYEESLRKWEEALTMDPENLEAKLNIEIVKEKIKSLSEK